MNYYNSIHFWIKNIGNIYNINYNRKEWEQLLLAISTTTQINNLKCTTSRTTSLSWRSTGSIRSTTSLEEFFSQF